MPLPGRHNVAQSSRSSNYKRPRSPDGKRRMDPPSRVSGSSARSGSPLRQREHRRDVRPSRKSDMRDHSPEAADSNGRSFSNASSKRKGSPKIDVDVSRVRDVDERSSRLAAPPRKMMRSVSPPVRDIPLAGPSRASPPRSYNRPTKVPAARRFPSVEASPPPAPRNYSSSTLPTSRGYTETATSSQSNTRSYSSSAAKRGYAETSTTFRRSASEERPFAHTSAQKRTTGHLTTSRFGGLRDSDETALLRDEDVVVKSDTLKGYVFNIDNESTKLSRSGHGIVRKIINPESLQVVRRPAPATRVTGSAYFDEDDWDGDELYRARGPPWTRSSEGSRPIFDREEIVQQGSGRPSRDDDFHGRGERVASRSPPIVQVARYVPSDHYRDDPRDSRNGQSHSRTAVTRDESSHSRPGPSRESRDAPTRSREAFFDEGDREHRSSRYESGDHVKASRSSRRDDNDDLRHELELRRDPSSHSGERIRSRARSREARAGSDSDLRVRINEKRTHSPEHGYRRERAEDRSRGRERHRSPSGERRRPESDRSRPREERRRPSPPPHERRHDEPEEYYEAPKPWEIDPEFVPRGRAYFEHDNREDGMMVRGRGRGGMRMRPSSFMYRGRGPRLPYRGPPPFHQGGYFVYNRGPMIRGFRPPRMPRRSSPQWEHDMFDKISAEPDAKMMEALNNNLTEFEDDITFDEDDPDFTMGPTKIKSNNLNERRYSATNRAFATMSLTSVQHPSELLNRDRHRSSNLSLNSLKSNQSISSSFEELHNYNNNNNQDAVISIEELRVQLNSCFTCGVSWQEEHVSLDCRECGGYSLVRPCMECEGRCTNVWKRDLTMSHAIGKARWEGECSLQSKKERSARVLKSLTADEEARLCSRIEKMTATS